MTEIVNFNKARKAKAREDAKAQAAANRIRFGQPKALRDKAQKEADRAARDLAGKKLED